MAKIYLGICKTHTVSYILDIIHHLSGQGRYSQLMVLGSNPSDGPSSMNLVQLMMASHLGDLMAFPWWWWPWQWYTDRHHFQVTGWHHRM